MTTMTTRCPHCSAKNRIAQQRVNEAAICGSCKNKLFEGKPIEGTSENLAVLIQADVPVVVDFWAPWCAPCRSFAPTFEQVAAKQAGAVRFVKVDTEAQQELSAQYRIRSIPTVMVFRGGELLETINGALPKAQFEQWLEQAVSKA
jgi:thioredoxin 2